MQVSHLFGVLKLSHFLSELPRLDFRQAIKAVGFVESGVEAKDVIQSGLVKVNGVVETQRGKKLVGGEVIEFNGSKLTIKR